MNDTMNNNYKPPLYRGHPIPLTSLAEDSFEDFVYQTLVVLGEQKGFQVQSGRQPSGDQGFDCTAKTKSGSLVCIQCKRYTGTLYTDTVATEIIKVALDGVLNVSTPKQHYIITCGAVAGKLRQQLRQLHYPDLKKKCEELLDHPDFKDLIKKVRDKSISPFETIVQYLDSLDNFIVWSGVDFENEISVVWSKLTSILEKHFSLELAFKEHPRPDFNLSNYTHSIDNNSSHLVPLQYQQSSLPEKLSYHGEIESHQGVIFSSTDLINHLQHGKKIVLSSAGGSGKSCSLVIIENELIQPVDDIKFLPIKINLRSYSRNTLDQTIKKRLGISFGSWKSLPFKFIFLFDALDEMLQHDTQAFIDELEEVTKGYGYVITLRNTGLNIETSLASISFCISVLPLSYRSAFEIAKYLLNDDILEGFYSAYRGRLSTIGYNSLSSPFALNLTVQYYKKNNSLPDDIEELLDNWIDSKITNDAKKINNTINKVNKISTKFIREAFALIIFKSRIDNNLPFIPKNSYDEILMSVYDDLESSNSYISRYLAFSEFTDIIHHYEVLTLGKDGFYSTPHPIISDYLISRLFASNWRKYSEKHLINSLQDIWYFSSNYINEEDHMDFMQSILSFDLILGAEVSRKLGGKCISIAEIELLQNEQSAKIITRGQAIFALGVLGTDTSLNRLRSDTCLLDEHHYWQRLRSLAAHGDEDVLRQVLKEKEMEAQMPFKASGGSYDIWFSAPPIILTKIARSRLNDWLINKNLPLCMCLDIIELYGDSYDVKVLRTILNKTENEKEFYKATQAMIIIDNNTLIESLKEITKNNHHFSYNAKNILLNLGIKSDIHDEFTFLIEQGKMNEAEMADSRFIIFLDKLVDFLSNFELTEDQIDTLITTYNNLNFNQDFYYYDLLWSLASKMKLSKFIPIAESAFKNKKSSEIHRAINYLSHIDKKNIAPKFSQIIDQYYYELEESSYGTKAYYAKYYLNQGRKNRAYEIITKSIAEILIEIEPDTITRDEYISCGNLWRIFHFLDINIAGDLLLSEPISLKFLLLDTSTSNNKNKVIKKIILSKTNMIAIENYMEKIKDNSIKLYVLAYLFENDLISNQIQYMKGCLPNLLAHHMFYPAIEKVCDRAWNDELAMFFLSCFVEQVWNPVSAQMFDKLTNFFAEKLTEKQLLSFENERKKPVNKLIERIYRIWLELNGVLYRDF